MIAYDVDTQKEIILCDECGEELNPNKPFSYVSNNKLHFCLKCVTMFGHYNQEEITDGVH